MITNCVLMPRNDKRYIKKSTRIDNDDNMKKRKEKPKTLIKFDVKELIGNFIILFGIYLLISFYGYIEKWDWLYQTFPFLLNQLIVLIISVLLIVIGAEIPRNFKDINEFFGSLG